MGFHLSYTVPKKEATEFTRELAARQDGPAVIAALQYLDNDELPTHWDREALFGLSATSNSDSEEAGESEVGGNSNMILLDFITIMLIIYFFHH